MANNNTKISINENTKIAYLIKANPLTIDTISEINKHFRKLKNPILRRTLAKRVTIREAAKIGGVTVEHFLGKLQAIGFSIENETTKHSETNNNTMDFDINDEKITELDVRPNIEAGNDPFKIIMGAIKGLNDGEILKIINSFEPIPLINILNKKGYASKVERPDDGVVVTYFKKGEQSDTKLEMDAAPTGEFNETYAKYRNKIKTIDVRALEMPGPMVAILEELEVLPEGHALFVHHKKMPKFLLPELKTRGVKFVEHRIDEHNIDFIFFK